MRTIKIYQDGGDNPRGWDNLGTIAYKHPRYSLGDEEINDPIDWLINKLELSEDYVFNKANKMGFSNYTQGTLEMLENMFFERFIALPLYLYDHSGITIRTYPFSCPWDSGKVGYIYITKKDARNEYGRLTGKKVERIKSYLKGEIKTFDHYLTGDVYGFELFEHEPGQDPEDGEVIDSCWGFYGTDWEKNGMLDCIGIGMERSEALKQLDDAEINYR